MSHFTVMVINTQGHDDVANQLAPFDEGIEVFPYEDGLVPQDSKDHFINHYTSAESPIYGQRDGDGNYLTQDLSHNASLSFEDLYAKFGNDWNGGTWRKDANGDWVEMSTYNPKSKWDWYQIGGRWSGMLRIKPGGKGIQGERSWTNQNQKLDFNQADQVYNQHIDWEGMGQEKAEKAAEFFDELAEAVGLDEDGRILQPILKWEELLEKFDTVQEAREIYHLDAIYKRFSKFMTSKGYYMESPSDFHLTKEEYVELERKGAVVTFAVLKDGEWFEKGSMGWFGMSSETKEESESWDRSFHDRFLKDLGPNALITIVDCHI